MEIKNIVIENIGRFKSLNIPLAPTSSEMSNVTVLIGGNGAGKTSVLKAIATVMSWFVARVRSSKGNGNSIPEDIILNGESSGSICVCVLNDFGESSNPEANPEDVLYDWTLAKSRKGKKGQHENYLTEASSLAEKYRKFYSLNDDFSFPLIAFYPAERVVLDIPVRLRQKHNFRQLDGYDNSLNRGVDFRRFFEWFREREDIENETVISEETWKKLLHEVQDDQKLKNAIAALNLSSKDKQLSAVREAISKFMEGFDNLRIRRKPRLHMSIDKNGTSLNVSQLSQGEKSLMALVGDIARRLAMMNPTLENPLHGDGVILIDEVDLHLHPSWQHTVVPRLTTTFPNCQFIITTHSPLVISECENALIYSLEDGVVEKVQSQYGQDANTVLLDVMDVNIRNEDINSKINDILDVMHDDIELAKSKLKELKNMLPDGNLEVSRLSFMLRKKEILNEKNK